MNLLLQAGLNPDKQTFFSWLGITYYLSKPTISAMLQQIASISAKGSALLLDFADENFFSSDVKRVQHMIGMAESSGEPMQSCFAVAELEQLLEKAGMLLYEHVSPEQIEATYFKKRNDRLHAFKHIHCALAVVQ